MELKLYEEFSLNLSLNQLRMVSQSCCQSVWDKHAATESEVGLNIITEHMFPHLEAALWLLGPQSDKIYPGSISYGDVERSATSRGL